MLMSLVSRHFKIKLIFALVFCSNPPEISCQTLSSFVSSSSLNLLFMKLQIHVADAAVGACVSSYSRQTTASKQDKCTNFSGAVFHGLV